jgi:trigger factor
MKLLEKNRKGNETTLKIEEDFAVVMKKTDEIFKKESGKYRIPGFRSGKAPRNIFDQHFGKGFLLEKALDDVVNDAYRAVIEQEDIHPVDYPKNLEVVEFEEPKPVVFSLTVTVTPEVKLQKYTGLKVDKKRVAISEPELDQAIQQMREHFAEYVDADRPIQDQDIVRYDMKALSDGQELGSLTRTNQGAQIGMAAISAEFDQQFLGLQKGATKDFQLSFPADHRFPDLKGKTVDFSVLIQEIKEKKLPEVDESFLLKIGESGPVDAFRAKTREQMEKHAQDESENAMKDMVIDELVKLNPVEIPSVMIDRQVDVFVDQMARNLKERGLGLEDYLKIYGKTDESLRQEYQEAARKRVAADLLLDQLIKKESIEITEPELEAELAKMAETTFKKPLAEVRGQLKNVEAHVKDYLAANKAVQFLVEKAKVATK